MIVIADASPINYLILIQEIDVLPRMYGQIIIPESVCEELSRLLAPESVRLWVSRPPAWLDIRRPTAAPDPELSKLDVGERDAILLAEELGAVMRLRQTNFRISQEVLDSLFDGS